MDLDIEWVSYQDYDQKLNTLIAADSQPDVIQINKVGGAYYYPILTQAIDAGQFVTRVTNICLTMEKELQRPMP